MVRHYCRAAALSICTFPGPAFATYWRPNICSDQYSDPECADSRVREVGTCERQLAPQVLFHLQTRQPAVLPPVCELFGLPADNDFIRPLHGKRAPDMAFLKVNAVGCNRMLVETQSYCLLDGIYGHPTTG